MARIRTIKPTFFTSRTVANLPVPVRLTFAGLWTYADDEGRGEDDARLIKAALWPLDDNITPKVVGRHLAQLADEGFICRYETSEGSFLHICKFKRHQRVNRPQPSIHPAPPDHGSFTESSVNDPPPLPDDSLPEGKGMEGKGSDNSSSSDSRLSRPAPDDDDQHTEDETRARAAAEADLARREAEKGPVGDRERWLAAAVRSRLRRGDLDPPRPAVAPASEPHPVDVAAEAQRQLMDLNAARRERPCPACEATGFVEPDIGDGVMRCHACGGTGVNAA